MLFDTGSSRLVTAVTTDGRLIVSVLKKNTGTMALVAGIFLETISHVFHSFSNGPGTPHPLGMLSLNNPEQVLEKTPMTSLGGRYSGTSCSGRH